MVLAECQHGVLFYRMVLCNAPLEVGTGTVVGVYENPVEKALLVFIKISFVNDRLLFFDIIYICTILSRHNFYEVLFSALH